MSETIYKVTECEVKKLGERQYEFTASTSTQDRDGEVIEASGWDLKNFKKNPVIMYAHDYRSLPIGKAPRVWISRDNELKNTVEFPPEGTYEFADIVERLVDTGYLKTESVGFIPKKWEDGDGEKAPKRVYTKQELLEISIVPVPSNPDALRNAIEDGVITTKEFEAITKREGGIIIKPSLAIVGESDTNLFANKIANAIKERQAEGITKPEETDDWIRIPVAECDVTATIDISKKEGIKALYCGKEKKVKTYMFDKRDPYNWTMAKAEKWVEDHKAWKDEGIEIEEEHPQPKEVSQGQILDELNYLIRLIESEGMNEDVEKEAWDLVREIMRLQGDDIPFDILEKVGAVLNQKNRDKLNQIKSLAQQILDSAGEEEPEKATEPSITLDGVKKIVGMAVTEAIEKAQGKVS